MTAHTIDLDQAAEKLGWPMDKLLRELGYRQSDNGDVLAKEITDNTKALPRGRAHLLIRFLLTQVPAPPPGWQDRKTGERPPESL